MSHHNIYLISKSSLGWNPIGLAQIGAVLDREGYEVAILDCNLFRMNREQIKEEVTSDPFDFIGIGGLVTTYSWQKETIQLIKKELPDTPIIAGGGCASSIPNEMMKWVPELDLIIYGEGEETILDLVHRFRDGKFTNLHKVKGIVYRKGKQVITKPPRPLIEDLDKLPYPAYDLLVLDDIPEGRGYFSYSPVALSATALSSKRRIDMIATRGCLWSCSFCWNTFGHGKIRAHSPKYMIDHIKYLRLRYAIDFVSFVDELFTANHKWVYEFCDLMEEEDLVGVVNWGCAAHVNTVNLKLLARMKDCGCSYLDYGMESMDDRILKSIKKGSTAKRNEEALYETLQVKLNPITNFMVGYTQEDVESILKTTQFWADNGIVCNPFYITPYPNSELYQKYKDKILEQYDGDLEKYVSSLGDATDLAVNLTEFDTPTLIGLRHLMFKHDIDRIKRWANAKKLPKKNTRQFYV